jgi:hypothetical protein
MSWYTNYKISNFWNKKTEKENIGGGIINKGSGGENSASINNSSGNLQELTEKVQALEQAITDQNYDNVGKQKPVDEFTPYATPNTPNMISDKASRLNPYHPNPEEMTLQDQLESGRSENLNKSISDINSKSPELIRKEPGNKQNVDRTERDKWPSTMSKANDFNRF